MHSATILGAPSLRAALSCVVCLLAVATSLGQSTTLTFDRLHWYDRVGNPHRVQGVNIEFFEEDTISADDNLGTLAVGSGNAAGYLQLTTTEWDVLDDELEVYAHLRTEIPGVATIGPKKNLVSDPDIFSETANRMPAGAALWLVPEGGNLTLPENPAQTLSIPDASSAGNATPASRSIGALQVVKFAHDYFSNSLGATVAPVSMQLYATETGYSSSRGNNITVDDNRWGSYDTTLHEYGHVIANNNQLHNLTDIEGWTPPGGYGQDSIALVGLVGTRGAWIEGVADYLAISAIKDGDLNTFVQGGNPNDPGLPATDLDEWHHQYYSDGAKTEEAHLLSKVNLESRQAWAAAGQNISADNVGEGDKSSVMRILWDLYDTDDTGAEPIAFAEADHNDRWALGAQTVFNTMRADGEPKPRMDGRLADLWDNVQKEHATAPKRAAELGELFQEYGVSAVPGLGVGGGVADDSATTDTTPLLVWSEQNSLYSEFFKVAIFDKLFTELILESPQLHNVTEWTVPAGSELAVGEYNWVVISNSVMQNGIVMPEGINFNYNAANNTVLSASYWSGAVQFRITAVPEPTAILLALFGLALLPRRRRR